MKTHIILGKNFGDEGKGLAVDYFSQRAQQSQRTCLVVRFNGGAQAGHTVDLPDRRFVFHQLSAGSFRRADTFWADSFLPDLYKLREEAEDFFQQNGRIPRILGSASCACVLIDDVLLNMALETSRGSRRHGSCGMGIDEAVQRSKLADYRVTLEELKTQTPEMVFDHLTKIRSAYSLPRLHRWNLPLDRIGIYGELLQDDRVLWNAALEMSQGAKLVELADPRQLRTYEEVLFEGAQGLLLDEEYTTFAPHLTSSRTGLYHPIRLCKALFQEESPEIVYVTRSYVTRHGNGPLPHEQAFKLDRCKYCDRTNLPNPWQGVLRFAPHGEPEEFLAPVLADLGTHTQHVSLFLTHLNESKGCVSTCNGDLPLGTWARDYQIFKHFSKVYLSDSPIAAETTCVDSQEKLIMT